MRTLHLLPCITAWALTAIAVLPLALHAEPMASAEPGAAVPEARGFAAPVEADALSRLRGGQDLTHNEMRLDGVTAGNVAEHVSTGANSIGAGAFSGMSGLPLVVQNSGANVLIQNAVIVNVKMQ